MIITERKETAATYILTTSDKVSFKITNNLFNMKSLKNNNNSIGGLKVIKLILIILPKAAQNGQKMD